MSSTPFRTVLAVLLVVAYPPGVLYWYLVHPFARSWRRVGAPVALGILVVLLAAGILVGLYYREALIGSDLGWMLPGVVVGVLLYLGAVAIEVKCRRLLKFRILTGVPEMSQDAPGTLLTDGIYGHVRHPRYVAVFLGTWGCALVANFSGVYMVVGIASLLLLGVVWLEERELSVRFGSAWAEYRLAVPRFFPRRHSSS